MRAGEDFIWNVTPAFNKNANISVMTKLCSKIWFSNSFALYACFIINSWLIKARSEPGVQGTGVKLPDLGSLSLKLGLLLTEFHSIQDFNGGWDALLFYYQRQNTCI